MEPLPATNTQPSNDQREKIPHSSAWPERERERERQRERGREIRILKYVKLRKFKFDDVIIAHHRLGWGARIDGKK